MEWRRNYEICPLQEDMNNFCLNHFRGQMGTKAIQTGLYSLPTSRVTTFARGDWEKPGRTSSPSLGLPIVS